MAEMHYQATGGVLKINSCKGDERCGMQKSLCLAGTTRHTTAFLSHVPLITNDREHSHKGF
jgi:hypothetical protein